MQGGELLLVQTGDMDSIFRSVSDRSMTGEIEDDASRLVVVALFFGLGLDPGLEQSPVLHLGPLGHSLAHVCDCVIHPVDTDNSAMTHDEVADDDLVCFDVHSSPF